MCDGFITTENNSLTSNEKRIYKKSGRKVVYSNICIKIENFQVTFLIEKKERKWKRGSKKRC
jgi:hypothetical protein